MSDATTVVLVHEAFADDSSWSGVIERLQKKGVRVAAPANPRRGVAVVRAHARRAAAAITEIEGSPVIMVCQPQPVADVIEAALANVG
jgi:hypothetical protein